MLIKTTLHTIGDSLWSNAERRVDVFRISADTNADGEFGELRVFFDPTTWDTSELGLIYTDSLFELELKEFLKSHGLDPSGIGYSEQGMQGYNFVSLDTDKAFIDSWKALGWPIEEY